MSERALYRHNLRCRACAHRFHVDRVTDDPNRVSPRCPRCAGKTKQSFVADVGMDVSAGKAPGVVGANVQVAAYDRAMEITMQDHQMTDIQDSSRPGSVYRAGESRRRSCRCTCRNRPRIFGEATSRSPSRARPRWTCHRSSVSAHRIMARPRRNLRQIAAA